MVVAAPGRVGRSAASTASSSPVGAARGHAEQRAGLLGPLHILGGQQGAGADHATLDLGHLADHVKRGGGAQGDLQRRQTAGDQRLGQRTGMGHILDHDHRHDRRAAAQGFGLLGGVLGGHVNESYLLGAESGAA